MRSLFLLILSVLAINAWSQSKTKSDSTANIILTDIDISGGKGALSSGVYVYFNLESKKAYIQTTVSNSDIEITYLYRLFKDRILIGPNGGYFYNIPYGGIVLVFAPTNFIETLHWRSWSLGEPDGEINFNNSMFLLAVNSISFKVWNFKASYSLIQYMENKAQHTATLKYSQKVAPNFLIYTDVGYDFSNEMQLLKIGVNWKK